MERKLCVMLLLIPAVFGCVSVCLGTDCADTALTGIPQEECEALTALYISTDGENWKDSTGWTDSDSPCAWQGITCAGGHVAEIRLSDNGLSGEIPPELGNLSRLRILNLSFGTLSGGIPPELGNLDRLETLDLRHSGLSGKIPPELGNAERLKSLSLDNCRLEGNIPPELGNLKELAALRLGACGLNGGIPPELGNAENLYFLCLSGNRLSGEIPPELGNLKKLTFLLAADCGLDGEIPPELGNLANLWFLNLQDTRLAGEIPPELGNAPGLEHLWLHGSLLEGPLPSELVSLNLSVFRFHDTGLREPGDAAFQSWLDSIPRVMSTDIVCGSPGTTTSTSTTTTTMPVTTTSTTTTVPGGTTTTTTTVPANNPPADITLTADTVTEGCALGTAVGEFAAADPDPGDTHAFSLSDDAWGAFVIEGNVLKTAMPVNFAAQNVFVIRARAEDSHGGSFEKSFVIRVLNANDPPADIILENDSVNEGAPAGTPVGDLSAEDPDNPEDFHTYSPVSGEGDTDNAFFLTDGAVLVTAAVFDYETKNSFSIRVRVEDSEGESFEKAFVIRINDVNEHPSDILLNNVRDVPENTEPGFAVGSLGTEDPDTGDIHTYYQVVHPHGGTVDNAFFTLDGNVLRTAAAFDYETKSEYTVYIRSNDSGGSRDESGACVRNSGAAECDSRGCTGWLCKEFRIRVADVNEPPEGIRLSLKWVNENQAPGTAVGIFTASGDPDADDIHSYALVSGEGSGDNSFFSIEGDALKTAASFDYEAGKHRFYIRTRAADARGLSCEQAFEIEVMDINDAPSDIILSSDTVSEKLPAGTEVGILTTADPDDPEGSGEYKYGLTAGECPGSAYFTIEEDILKTAAVFDFETKSSYAVCVTSEDEKGGVLEKTFTVHVTPHKAPVLSSSDAVLDPINEDETDNSGNSVAEILESGPVGLADGSPVTGIAVISVDNSNGVWQYSLNNGAEWTDFTDIAGDEADMSESARLLNASLAGDETCRINNEGTERGTTKSDGLIRLEGLGDEDTLYAYKEFFSLRDPKADDANFGDDPSDNPYNVFGGNMYTFVMASDIMDNASGKYHDFPGESRKLRDWDIPRDSSGNVLIRLAHPRIEWNLVVALAKDISVDIQDIRSGIADASDYLYNYTDGYSLIKNIVLIPETVKDTAYWNWAGVRIKKGAEGWRVFDLDDPPYDQNGIKKADVYVDISEYRQGGGGPSSNNLWHKALAHELGHYFFRFADEYKNGTAYKSIYPKPGGEIWNYRLDNDGSSGDGNNFFPKSYGVMDNYSLNGELSDCTDYMDSAFYEPDPGTDADADIMTYQYMTRGMSTWEWFKQVFEEEIKTGTGLKGDIIVLPNTSGHYNDDSIYSKRTGPVCPLHDEVIFTEQTVPDKKKSRNSEPASRITAVIEVLDQAGNPVANAEVWSVLEAGKKNRWGKTGRDGCFPNYAGGTLPLGRTFEIYFGGMKETVVIDGGREKFTVVFPFAGTPDDSIPGIIVSAVPSDSEKSLRLRVWGEDLDAPPSVCLLSPPENPALAPSGENIYAGNMPWEWQDGELEITAESGGIANMSLNEYSIRNVRPCTLGELYFPGGFPYMELTYSRANLSGSGSVALVSSAAAAPRNGELVRVGNVWSFQFSESVGPVKDLKLSVIFFMDTPMEEIRGLDGESLGIYGWDSAAGTWNRISGGGGMLYQFSVTLPSHDYEAYALFGERSSDTEPPEMITDFWGETSDRRNSVELGWTAPSDSGKKVFAYQLCFGTEPFTESSRKGWICEYPYIDPAEPGTPEIYVTQMPETGRDYYFSICSMDTSGNISPRAFSAGPVRSQMTDEDGDGMYDIWETSNGLDPTADDSRNDEDWDGLTNLEEYMHNTSPWASDSDQDRWSDGDEVRMGSDPNDRDSHPYPDTPGDLNCSSGEDLEDAVFALQFLTGTGPDSDFFCSGSIDGDGKVGLAEVIYILRRLAGILP